MSVITGKDINAVIGKETTWGTEVEGAGILVMPGTRATQNVPTHHINEASQTWPRADATATSSIRASGTIIQAARYEDWRLPSYLLGIGSEYSTPSSGSGAYSFTHTPASHIEGLFFTLGMQKGSAVETWRSNKAQQLRLSGAAGDDLICKWEMATLIRDVIYTSTTVDADTFSSLTFPGDRENPIRFDQLVFRLNAHGGDALDSGDELAITGFDLSFQRILDDVADNVTGRYRREPVNSGQSLEHLVLNITFAEFTNTNKAYWADLIAKNHFKADLTFTGGTVGSTNYSLLIQIPELVIEDVGDMGAYTDAGKLPASLSLRGLLPGDTSTTGMAFNELVKFTVVNSQSAKAVS